MSTGDIERVAGLCGQLGYPSTPAEVAARFEALARSRDDAILVADERPESGPPAGSLGTGVVGWVHVRIVPTLEADTFAELAGLVVDEAAHGRGVGRLLVEAAEEWAVTRGYREMRVRSNVVRTGAHQFYRRLGYEIIKTQTNFRRRLSKS